MDRACNNGFMAREPIPRLDNSNFREKLLPFCRLAKGGIWEDPKSGHRVGVLDAADNSDVKRIFKDSNAALLVHDPHTTLKLEGRIPPALQKEC